MSGTCGNIIMRPVTCSWCLDKNIKHLFAKNVRSPKSAKQLCVVFVVNTINVNSTWRPFFNQEGPAGILFFLLKTKQKLFLPPWQSFQEACHQLPCRRNTLDLPLCFNIFVQYTIYRSTNWSETGRERTAWVTALNFKHAKEKFPRSFNMRQVFWKTRLSHLQNFSK